MEKNLTQSQEEIIRNLAEGIEVFDPSNSDIVLLLENNFISTETKGEDFVHYKLLWNALQYYNWYLRPTGSDYTASPFKLDKAIAGAVHMEMRNNRLTESQEEILANLMHGIEVFYSEDSPDIKRLLNEYITYDYVQKGYSLLPKGTAYVHMVVASSRTPLNQAIASAVERVEAAKTEHRLEIARREEESILVERAKYLKTTGATEEVIALLGAKFVLNENKGSLPVAMVFCLDGVSYRVESRTNSTGLIYVSAERLECEYPNKFFYFGQISFDDALLATVAEIRSLRVPEPEPEVAKLDEEVRKTAIACLLAMIQGGNMPDAQEAIRLAKEIHELME